MSEEKILNVRGLLIGEGIPKICVPVVEGSEMGIVRAAEEASASPADLLEWRVDYFENVRDLSAVDRVLQGIREVIGQMPLLVTYRTRPEGGAAEEDLTDQEYTDFCEHVTEGGEADLIDVEQRFGRTLIRGLKLISEHTAVLVSGHDFQNTPSYEELITRYLQMEEWGADLRKLAVMPHNAADVLTLLSACETAARSGSPVIGIAMGEVGAESRILGELCGSAVTFGCLGRSSAPGQANAGELAELLRRIHALHERN